MTEFQLVKYVIRGSVTFKALNKIEKSKRKEHAFERARFRLKTFLPKS